MPRPPKSRPRRRAKIPSARVPADAFSAKQYRELLDPELKRTFDAFTPAQKRSLLDFYNHAIATVGVEALDPLETFSELGVCEDDHLAGDPFALPRAVMLCRDQNAHLPAWAVKALADGFEKYFLESSGQLDEALFGQDRSRGRHADPRRKGTERWVRLASRAAVTAARNAGYKGDEAFSIARDILHEKYPEIFNMLYRRKITATVRGIGLQTVRRHFHASKVVDDLPSQRRLVRELTAFIRQRDAASDPAIS